MGIVGEYIANLGLDAAKQHVKSKIDEYKLKSELKEYIENQRKYNNMCTIAEECDFQGLIEYITQELLDDIEQRFFSTSVDVRRKAHEKIISKAVLQSKASTDKSKNRVGCLIAQSMEIIRQFFKKKVSVSDYLVAAEIVDEVNKNTIHTVKSATSNIQHTVLEGKKNISEQLDLINQSIANGSLYSIENM